MRTLRARRVRRLSGHHAVAVVHVCLLVTASTLPLTIALCLNPIVVIMANAIILTSVRTVAQLASGGLRTRKASLPAESPHMKSLPAWGKHMHHTCGHTCKHEYAHTSANSQAHAHAHAHAHTHTQSPGGFSGCGSSGRSEMRNWDLTRSSLRRWRCEVPTRTAFCLNWVTHQRMDHHPCAGHRPKETSLIWLHMATRPTHHLQHPAWMGAGA